VTFHCLPGVVTGADKRLHIKGVQPSQGALQDSSASLIDPSTGDFDLELPGQKSSVWKCCRTRHSEQHDVTVQRNVIQPD
jgi:hypothetical protein